jgi:CRISPR-associated protein Cas2
VRKYDFIIAYDIADVKRLRKIAKVVEKKAMRIQYSIYIFYDATQKELTSLLDAICKIYDEKYDDIRVYKVKNRGLHLGAAIDLNNPFVF